MRPWREISGDRVGAARPAGQTQTLPMAGAFGDRVLKLEPKHSETRLTTSIRRKLIKTRFGVLALAAELRDRRLACKRGGLNRSHACHIKRACEKFRTALFGDRVASPEVSVKRIDARIDRSVQFALAAA